jgi:hypothetical protein
VHVGDDSLVYRLVRAHRLHVQVVLRFDGFRAGTEGVDGEDMVRDVVWNQSVRAHHAVLLLNHSTENQKAETNIPVTKSQHP